MGVDCKITLPANVRIDDVAKVIGISAGCPKEKRPLGPSYPNSFSIHVKNIAYDILQTMPQAPTIVINQDCVDGLKHHVMFFFEYKGKRLLNPRSTAFWIAVAHRLVDFFGGSIDYRDCDDVEVDYERPEKSNAENCPEGGNDWDVFQERLWALEPMTTEEMKRFEAVAAY